MMMSIRFNQKFLIRLLSLIISKKWNHISKISAVAVAHLENLKDTVTWSKIPGRTVWNYAVIEVAGEEEQITWRKLALLAINTLAIGSRPQGKRIALLRFQRGDMKIIMVKHIGNYRLTRWYIYCAFIYMTYCNIGYCFTAILNNSCRVLTEIFIITYLHWMRVHIHIFANCLLPLTKKSG